jgi:expansin (peptidoglycan-binding protein)
VVRLRAPKALRDGEAAAFVAREGPAIQCRLYVLSVTPAVGHGGKIVCMESFTEVQALRTDKLPGEYLIVGADLDGNPAAMVVVTR